MTEIDPKDRTTILVHYYRAMVGRADVWRVRMDTTTNWAIGTTAALVTFTLGDPDIRHYIVFLGSLLTLTFLLLEARRLTFYRLWQQRVLLIERRVFRPAFGLTGPETTLGEALERDLDPHLGHTVPTMSLAIAAARRLRRVYLYLFAVQLLAWLLKLANHPTAVDSFAALRHRAGVGAVPGTAVMAGVCLVFLGAVTLAFVWGGVERHAQEEGAEGPEGPT